MATELIRIDAILGAVKPLMQHIVASDDTWLWIDAGVESTPDQWILPELERRGLTPPARNVAVITHADVDHFGGMARLCEAVPSMTVIAHRADRALLESVDRLMAVRYDAFAAGGITLPDWRDAQLRERAGRPITPALLVDDEVVVTVGGDDWRVIHLPGHADGHLGVWNERSGALIAGDAVMGWGVVDGDGLLQPPHYVDVAAYRATIVRLLGLDLRELRLSHEEVMTGGRVHEFLVESLDAVALLESTVAAAVRSLGPAAEPQLMLVCEYVQQHTDRWATAIPSAFAASVDAHLRAVAA